MPKEFLDLRFPVDISYGSTGGPSYHTSVVSFKSGKEKRSSSWQYSRSSYDVSYGIEDYPTLEKLVDMFHIAKGRAFTFRYKDPVDYKSCPVDQTPSPFDQEIGEGDGLNVDFQLWKRYKKESLDGSIIYEKIRKITKPVYNTVLAAISGEETSNFSVDHKKGVITFDSAPPSGEVITAGYEFDVHARFDVDEISVNLEDYQTGSIDVPVIEVKD